MAAAAIIVLGGAMGAPAAMAQSVAPNTITPPSIATVAGTGRVGFGGDGGPAIKAKLRIPTGVAEDVAGDLYIADTLNYRIRKVSPTGVISTVAGSGVPGFSGDGGLATSARFLMPMSPAVDGSGDLYVADSGNNRIRKISSTGIITTVAGSGSCGSTGDGGLAVAARLCDPTAVAVGASGNLYVADTGNNKIRKVTPAGIISTFAGTGRFGSTGDGGPALGARLAEPNGVAVDTLSDLFIVDSANNKIRKVDAAGVITTFAGTGANGFHGDGGPATHATLTRPAGVGLDSLGNVYIADTYNFRIRVVTAGGNIFTYAGTGVPGYGGDGGVATKARMNVVNGDLAVGPNTLYFTDTLNERVRAVQAGPPPNISESMNAIILPVSALVLIAGAYLVVRRGRRSGVVAA